MTLVNHDPGPSTTQSASSTAATASGRAGGRGGSRRTSTTRPDVVARLVDGTLPKGEALGTARIAGIMAAKQTPALIPLCHPLPLGAITVDFETDTGAEEASVTVVARVRTRGVTGVEMEALTAATVAALTLFDMIKAVDHLAVIGDVKVLEKSGGKSGEWRAP